MSAVKNYDIFDLVKFILSLFIVSLHSGIVPDILIPVIRTAVPLFFIISSYLFFEKKSALAENSAGGGTLRRFVSRNLKLYFFWAVVLLPVTVVYDIHTDLASEIRYSALEMMIRYVQRFLFTAFPASWYIIASVIAVIVLYRIPKKYNSVMLVFSFALYIICCISSNYYYLFGTDSAIIKFDSIFTLVFYLPPYLSFLVAFIWIGIGKVCAESKIAIAPMVRRIVIGILAIMLYLEYFAIRIFSLSRTNDCYIMLVPLCFFIFLELKSADNFKAKNAVTLRKMSTIIYCSHITVIRICSSVLKYIFHYSNRVMVFAITQLICMMACVIIFNLEKKHVFSLLKYSH